VNLDQLRARAGKQLGTQVAVDFEKSLLRLSLVGFNAKKDRAIVSILHECVLFTGAVTVSCNRVNIAYVQKIDRRWEVVTGCNAIQ
jgi:hypothetical protein